MNFTLLYDIIIFMMPDNKPSITSELSMGTVFLVMGISFGITIGSLYYSFLIGTAILYGVAIWKRYRS